ncbi:MAG: cache domain-containing protein, partial [Lachnospiraceae bacterium]|nr:cache domain-containing protein [Lachnospiraceae bacterium]
MRSFLKVFKWISKIGVKYAVFLGVILTLLTALIVVDTKIGTSMVASEAKSYAQLIADESENLITGYMDTCLEAVSLTSRSVESMLGQSSSIKDIKSFIVLQTESYSDVIDSNYTGLYGLIKGSYVDGVGWIPDKDYAPKSRPWYTDAVKSHGSVAMVNPYMDSQTKKVTMSMSKLLKDGQSVIAIDLSLGKVQEYVESLAKKYPSAEVILICDDGTIVADSNSSHTLNNIFGKAELLHAFKMEDISSENEGFINLK